MKTLTLLVLLLALPVLAEDIYVSQDGAGTTNSMAWLRTAANWGLGANKVSPGDTVHLCGTLTDKLPIWSGGSPGSILTLLFEPGAKFYAPTWSVDVAVMQTVGTVSHLTIDGGAGTNGVIECTANGTGLAYSNSCFAIGLGSCSDIIIKNLRITNLYYREANINEYEGAGGVYVSGNVTNFYMQNCLIDMAASGLSIGNGTYSENIVIRSNTIHDVNWGIYVAGSNPGSIITNVQIYANRIWKFNRWDSLDNFWHHDGIFISTDAGALNKGTRIYRNSIGPYNGANITTLIYVASADPTEISDCWIYNNLLLAGVDPDANDFPNNPAITLWGTNSFIANNTYIYSNTPTASFIACGPSNLVYNNLGYHAQNGFYSSAVYPAYCDYNVYGGSTVWAGAGTWYTFAEWQALGLDTHSSTNTATLDANYCPATNDIVARFRGTNLSAYFTTDFYGTPRTNQAGWTIGAIESSGVSAGEGSPSTNGVVVVPNPIVWRVNTLRANSFTRP